MPFHLPRVTKALLIANIVGFVLQWLLGDGRLLAFMLWPLGGDVYDPAGMAPSFMPWQFLCQLLVTAWAGEYGPVLGASGGVFGLLLAYGMLFPNQRVMLLFPPIPMKARTLVILYGLFELGVGLTGLQPGVAHFAHLGGMLFGWLLIRYWRGQPPFGGSKPKPPMRIVR